MMTMWTNKKTILISGFKEMVAVLFHYFEFTTYVSFDDKQLATLTVSGIKRIIIDSFKLQFKSNQQRTTLQLFNRSKGSPNDRFTVFDKVL